MPLTPSRTTAALDADAQWRVTWLEDKYAHLHPQVQQKLLRAGGHAVVMPSLGRFERTFLERAELVRLPVRQGQGRRSDCHRNATSYYRRDPGRYRIVCGFGLNWDSQGVGCWRHHTWIKDTHSHEIVETTHPRAVYYGVELGRFEADQFASQYPEVADTLTVESGMIHVPTPYRMDIHL